MTRATCCKYSVSPWKTGLRCFLRSSSEKGLKALAREILRPFLKHWKESRMRGEIYRSLESLVRSQERRYHRDFTPDSRLMTQLCCLSLQIIGKLPEINRAASR